MENERYVALRATIGQPQSGLQCDFMVAHTQLTGDAVFIKGALYIEKLTELTINLLSSEDNPSSMATSFRGRTSIPTDFCQ